MAQRVPVGRLGGSVGGPVGWRGTAFGFRGFARPGLNGGFRGRIGVTLIRPRLGQLGFGVPGGRFGRFPRGGFGFFGFPGSPFGFGFPARPFGFPASPFGFGFPVSPLGVFGFPASPFGFFGFPTSPFFFNGFGFFNGFEFFAGFPVVSSFPLFNGFPFFDGFPFFGFRGPRFNFFFGPAIPRLGFPGFPFGGPGLFGPQGFPAGVPFDPALAFGGSSGDMVPVASGPQQADTVAARDVQRGLDEGPSLGRHIAVPGTGSPAGDSLVVERVSVMDVVPTRAVRLTWRSAGLQAEQVAFFLADSAQAVLRAQTLRAPPFTALFEPPPGTAFAGMTVGWPDGTTSTRLVPYRAGRMSR
ncbi:MAG TPA: hypothetical protein VJQ46_02885 [Gemmatimonadales bacterium]|nr:hypothetical protein [Gemmatimonadales bacterium]